MFGVDTLDYATSQQVPEFLGYEMSSKLPPISKRRAIGKEIAKMGKRSVHVHELSEYFMLPTWKIRYWLGVNGITAVKCHCQKARPSLAMCIALRQKGLSQSEVSLKMLISRQRVSQMCKNARDAGVKKV